MLKIVVPLGSCRTRRIPSPTALPVELTEIDGQPLLESVVARLRPDELHQFVFVTNQEDARRWALDDVARQIAPGCAIVVAPRSPANPVFASLLAADEIDSDHEVVVAESTRVFDGAIDAFLSQARTSSFDGCTASFRCTHPKWNYLLEELGEVLQVVQNRPVSDQALAPVLWLRRARDYLDAAERHVVRHLDEPETRETSCVVNELVLAGRRIGNWRIPGQSTPQASIVATTPAHRHHRPKSAHDLADS